MCVGRWRIKRSGLLSNHLAILPGCETTFVCQTPSLRVHIRLEKAIFQTLVTLYSLIQVDYAKLAENATTIRLNHCHVRHSAFPLACRNHTTKR